MTASNPASSRQPALASETALVEQAPRFSIADAERISAELFGLSGNATPLISERDQNFLLTTAAGERFVLKLANAAEQESVLDFQNCALARATSQVKSLAVSQLVPARDGAPMMRIPGAPGQHHFVRMMRWVPGVTFETYRPHRCEVLASVGAAIAQLDSALAGFTHPAKRRKLHWDIQHALEMRELTPHIANGKRRALVERMLEGFERVALPALPALRAQVIHNDANEENLLLDGATGRVTGLIDFGDLVHAPLVCDLAVAATYALLGKPDPISAAADVARGYHSVLPLEERELALLYHLICTRLCLSVTLSAYQSARAPENEYLRTSENDAWAALELLAATSPELAHYTFRDACGLPACPREADITAWLRKNAASFAPVVTPDPRVAPVRIFDLSVSSRELPLGVDPTDSPVYTKWLFGVMQKECAAWGVGRYDEPRLCYRGERFEIPGNDGPELRTLHIGLDLFAPPGAPVHAPLDGRVHSFADNSAAFDYGPTVILEHEADGVPFFTLYGHLSRESLAGLREGAAVRRGQQIGAIGETAVNGGWTPHLHFQVMADMLGRHGDFPGVAAPSRRSLWLSLCPDPNLIVGIPHEKFPPAPASGGEILAVRRKYLGPSLGISYKSPLHLVRGYRQNLYDAEGRIFLDAVNNVPHVGHSHPRVVEALQRQAAVLNTNTRYLYGQLTDYVERLVTLFPEPLRVCFLVCSGSEANELALRLARAHTHAQGVVVLDHAYHGNSTTLVNVSPYKFSGPGGEGAPPWVQVVPVPDLYRGPYHRDDPQAGAKYAAAVAEACARATSQGHKPATFLHESMMGTAGQILFPEGFLRAAYGHARAAGAVCIADEVQVGLGRPGTHFWGFETQGVVPDIVTLGKPLGNGHPMGAVLTTAEIAASFATGMEYFNTFGGNPVSCAVGLAVLDVLRDEGLQETARAVGERLLGGLRELQQRHTIIGDVRGSGFFIGVELVNDRVTRAPAAAQAAYVVERMRERGILIGVEGPKSAPCVLKIRPPICFSAADAGRLLATLDTILAETPAQPLRR